MSQDRYDAWKQARARADVPADFADRVLHAIHARQTTHAPRFLLLLHSLVASRTGRVVLCSAGCAVCLVRLLQVAGLFLFAH